MDAVAAVVSEMVTQQKAMHQRMATMMQTMHGGGMEPAAMKPGEVVQPPAKTKAVPATGEDGTDHASHH